MTTTPLHNRRRTPRPTPSHWRERAEAAALAGGASAVLGALSAFVHGGSLLPWIAVPAGIGALLGWWFGPRAYEVFRELIH